MTMATITNLRMPDSEKRGSTIAVDQDVARAIRQAARAERKLLSAFLSDVLAYYVEHVHPDWQIVRQKQARKGAKR
jgi:hypothetical protein